MKMDDDEVLDCLRRKEESAGNYVWGTLGQERKEALEQYHRQPYGNEEEGWSQVVTSDIQDSVEWVLPSLIGIFTSTDRAVSFEPTKAEDVDGAEQATDTCNYVFYKQNPGFLILYSAIKDALILRNCAVMWRKEEKEVVSHYPFKQMPVSALAMTMQEGDEIVEADTDIVMDEAGGPVEVVSGRIKRVEQKKTIKIESFPPDEMLIDRDWTSPLLDDCPYVARMVRVTVSDLKQMGFDVEPGELKASGWTETVGTLGASLSSISQDDSFSDGDDDEEEGPLTEGWMRIEFVLMDADGDGIAERRCIYRLENRILSNEICSHVQIATASPVLNTHRWDGVSLTDLVKDIQKIHSELLRQTFNNLYLTNNPRAKVVTDASGNPLANMDDLLDSRPGGIARMRDLNNVSWDVVPFAASASLPMLEYVQGMRENRTGVSRTSMGMNPDSLNNTATGRQIDQTAAMQRIELMARVFAEILIKPIFKGVLKLLTDGEMEKIAFRLRNEFVEYDPNEWRDGYDMTINVGLGSGDKVAQIQKLTMVLQGMKELMPLRIATPKNIYYAASKLVEASGFKDVQNFLTDPESLPPQQPQKPLELQLKEMELQQKSAESGQRHQERMSELEAQLRLQSSNDQRDSEREQNKAYMETQAEAMRLQYEDKWKELDNNTKVLVAEINKRGELQKTAMTINASNTDEMGADEYGDDGQPVARMSVADLVNAVNQNMAQLLGMQQQSHAELVQHMTRPKQIVRDATGRAQGIA